MTEPVDIEKLKALGDRATQPPWQRSGVRAKAGAIKADFITCGPDGFQIAFFPVGSTDKEHVGAIADAEFVARLVSAFPAIISELEAGKKARLRLSELCDALGYDEMFHDCIDPESIRGQMKQLKDGLYLMNSIAHTMMPPDEIGPGQFIPWCKSQAENIASDRTALKAAQERIAGLRAALEKIAAMDGSGNLSMGEQVFVVTSARAAIKQAGGK